jgi:hypothetical protein
MKLKSLGAGVPAASSAYRRTGPPFAGLRWRGILPHPHANKP